MVQSNKQVSYLPFHSIKVKFLIDAFIIKLAHVHSKEEFKSVQNRSIVSPPSTILLLSVPTTGSLVHLLPGLLLYSLETYVYVCMWPFFPRALELYSTFLQLNFSFLFSYFMLVYPILF